MKMNRLGGIIAFMGILIVSPVDAQQDKRTFLSKIVELCPTADIVEIETKADYTEIEYWCEGVLTEVGINHNKEVIFIETEAEIPSDVLTKIQNKLDKKYYGWAIDEYALIVLPDTSFYKVEIQKSGVEENLYFTLDGKYFQAKNMAVSESWDIKSLSQSSYYKTAAYDFTNPNKTYVLPEVLKEISGISWAGDHILYCVQDETGIIFKYNIEKEELAGMIRFTDIGDFEDIALDGDTAYILRSDGTLFYFNHANFNGKFEKTVVPLQCMNIEGLFVDGKSKTFLIACKDQLIHTYDSIRTVYVFSRERKHLPEIAVTINLDEINLMLHNRYPEIHLEKVQFNPSAIAVHPITKEKYILSATNRLLAVYRENSLIDLFPLPAELFYKPEGIDFTKNGDLFISSEGEKKGYLDGKILLFKGKLQ